MNAKVIKPVTGQLLDESMRIIPVAVTYRDLESLINTSSRPASAFDAWQFFCARMFLLECGLNQNRN
ncbi:MAG: hypothetical protein KGL39_13225 [Patescibacteria group bacterium]|nr:hypothetical protein [Patescibacteria group bacterium]